MNRSVINKIIVLIILFSWITVSFCDAQISTSLQGQIKKIDGTLITKEQVFLIQAEKEIIVDSTLTDTIGGFHFESLVMGNYSIGLKAGADKIVSDVVEINELNPIKQNQHFILDDGSLACIESNYLNIKDALENKENVFVLDLNSLQFDVAEKSLAIAIDGTKKLSPKIGEFINLESLSININLIKFIPPEIGNLRKLTVLNASLNKLDTLPAEMENLKNLKELNLSKNDFRQFPELITKYSKLEVLNFESNPITTLPSSINQLKNLKEISLERCFDLSTLPPQISELSNLEILNLSKCEKLKTLPEEINNLKNLKVLDVTGTKISTKKFQEAVPECEVRK